MSKRKEVSPIWREFEELASRIERVLAPKEAVVKTPDRVRDLFTGHLREIDASIRYKIGSVAILIAIECRRRGRAQDDTWIEQLSKKREKIGAAKIIAVSSNGFSSSAVKTAALSGVELRTIREISEADIASWCEMRFIHYCLPSVNILKVRVFDESGNAIGIDDLRTCLHLTSNLLSPGLPVLASLDGAFCINDVLSSWQKEFEATENPLNNGTIPIAGETEKTVIAPFAPKKYWLAGSDNRFISAIELTICKKLEIQLIPINQRYSYSEPGGIILNGADFLLPSFDATTGKAARVALQKNAEGKIVMTISLEDQTLKDLSQKEGNAKA